MGSGRTRNDASASTLRVCPSPLSSEVGDGGLVWIWPQATCNARCHHSAEIAHSNRPDVVIKNPNVAARLACWSDGRSTVKDMALAGFHVLVDASLPSNGCSADREQESTVDLRQLSQRLGDFWHRLRIPPLGVTGNCEDYVEAFERKAGFMLDESMRAAPLMRGAAVARLHVLGHAVLEVSKVDLLGRRFDVEGLNDLVRRLELVPQEQWPGIVVCCRHQSPDGTAWLMPKRGEQGWRFDSALFD